MKSNLFIFRNLFYLTVLFSFLLVSCSIDRDKNSEVNEDYNLSSENGFSNNQSIILSNVEIINSPENTLELSITNNNFELVFNSSVDKNGTNSNLSVYKDNKELFDTDFYMVPCDIIYIEVQDDIELEAEFLVQEGISVEDLKVVNDIMTNSYIDIINEIKSNEERKLELFSNFFFHRSIVNTSKRSIASGEDCQCTTHPRHLSGETYFNCQEDIYMNVEELEKAISDYIKETGEQDESTLNLLNYIENTNDSQIRYDEYYNFYFPKSEYIMMLENKALEQNYGNAGNITGKAAGDCAWWCPLGCGSSHGCCGNYSGCCLYWNIVCYVHDEMCTDCTPEWFCLPGCIPDNAMVIVNCDV